MTVPIDSQEVHTFLMNFWAFGKKSACSAKKWEQADLFFACFLYDKNGSGFGI
jgi:hypothetical protein